MRYVDRFFFILCDDVQSRLLILLAAGVANVDSPERLRVLTDKNVNDIYNVMGKPGGKNADGTPDRGQQVLVIAQENLKLAAFLFHHRWRCTLH